MDNDPGFRDWQAAQALTARQEADERRDENFERRKEHLALAAKS